MRPLGEFLKMLSSIHMTIISIGMCLSKYTYFTVPTFPAVFLSRAPAPRSPLPRVPVPLATRGARCGKTFAGTNGLPRHRGSRG